MKELKAVEENTQIINPPVVMVCDLIQKAMQEIGPISKDSTARNYSGKEMYKFRGIDAVYNALNPIMAKLGLFIIPEVLNQSREERQSTSGTTLIYSILTVKFTMYAPDGSSVSGTVVGEGMDSGDKASNKAMSAAMKYFCFQTFMIPTEEMSDPDSETHEVVPKSKQVQKNENPPAAQVTATAKLPETPKTNPVMNYLANEKAYMARLLGITSDKDMNAWFSGKTKELIKSGAVENVATWGEYSMEQAKSLCQAIYATYLNKGEGQ